MNATRLGGVAGIVIITAVMLVSVDASASQPQPNIDLTPTSAHHGFVPGHLLVTFKPGTSDNTRSSAMSSVHGHQQSALRHLRTVVVSVPAGSEQQAGTKLEANPNVASVELDWLARQVDTIPNDPYFAWSGTAVLSGGQWGDKLTQATKAWDITTGSSAVTVAVVDSGIDDAHPDLSGQLVAGTSVIGGSTIDTHGHGEYVAGTIGAKGNNAIGPAGYCWKCRLMPVKISNDGTASYSAMASAITWATDHGARVINVSYAGTSPSSTLDAAVAYATNHGAVVVAASGNSGVDSATYPAHSPGAIAVGASDQHDNLMTYSNYGSWVDVAAPTGDITTWLKDPKTGLPYGYGPVGGTSISAPVVSGIVALMLSAAPNATVNAVKSALFSSADPVTGVAQDGSSATVKYGRVNAYQALLAVTGQAAAPAPTPTSAPTPTPAPTVTPSPTPTPTPTATPTTAPTPTPTASTQVFSGSINKKSASRTYNVSLPNGTTDARLTFTKCSSLALALKAGSSTVASATGPSVLVLDKATAAGTYAYVVQGAGQCSFTLAVSVLAP
jgi:thermitase